MNFNHINGDYTKNILVIIHNKRGKFVRKHQESFNDIKKM